MFDARPQRPQVPARVSHRLPTSRSEEERMLELALAMSVAEISSGQADVGPSHTSTPASPPATLPQAATPSAPPLPPVAPPVAGSSGAAGRLPPTRFWSAFDEPPSTSDDERIARELQAAEQREAEQRRAAAAACAWVRVSADERLARDLDALERQRAGANPTPVSPAVVPGEDEAKSITIPLSGLPEASGAVRGEGGAAAGGGAPRHDLTNDERLARELQAAENAMVPRLPEGAAQDVTNGDGCAGCGQPLPSVFNRILGGSQVYTVGGRRFHAHCAVCTGCRQPLGGGLVSCDARGRLYHGPCAIEKLSPKCDCCKQRIPSKAGRTSFITNEFWKERYCPAHSEDGTPHCTSCHRMRTAGSEELVVFDDGRHLCLMCLETMIADTESAQPLYSEILDFYADFGMKHSERPPMMLVDDSALNEYSARKGIQIGGPMTHTRGVCLTEHHRFIQVASISRGRLSRMNSKVSRVPLERSTVVFVQAILVLAGLPRVATGAILAHEAMHAWFAMNKYRGLPLEVEEGMCQLMAYLWVERQGSNDGSSEETLARFVAHQIRTDRSYVYGDGFRAALASFQEHGLAATLRHLKEHSCFPPLTQAA